MTNALDHLDAVMDRGGALTNAEDVYMRIQDMPLDDPPLLEGNDAWHAILNPDVSAAEVNVEEVFDADPDDRALMNLRTTATNLPLRPLGLYVPLKRTLKPGMRGKDVLAVQRAMAKAGLRKWGVGFTGIFGPGLKANVKAMQKRAGVQQTGNYNAATHAYAKRYFDKYGAWLMASAKVPDGAGMTARERIVAAAMFGYHYRGLIHYTQGPSRMYGVRHKIRIPKIPYYEDCSSFATWTYWHAGLRDPNGLGYNGFGFTGTLANHGHRVGTPQPGDLALYGRYPYSHVTIYVGNGRCVSHGSEIGPLLVNVHYRPVNHFRSYF